MSEPVKELPAEIRELLEIQPSLGRIIRETPPPAERRQIVKQLSAYFEKVDTNLEGVDDGEWDEAVNEAMRHVRPTYQAE